VEFGIVVDERQVLALRRGIAGFHVGIVDCGGLLVNGSVRMLSLPLVPSFNHAL
jgi:hypothetical protein